MKHIVEARKSGTSCLLSYHNDQFRYSSYNNNVCIATVQSYIHVFNLWQLQSLTVNENPAKLRPVLAAK